MIPEPIFAKIQSEAAEYEPLPEDFNPSDHYGGNFDDAFNAGVRHGRAELAKELSALIR
jgi:hypothetical protein